MCMVSPVSCVLSLVTRPHAEQGALCGWSGRTHPPRKQLDLGCAQWPTQPMGTN